MTSDIVERITEYLSAGGLFNPELMEHDKVRDMVIQCRDEIESLRSRLAEAEYQWKYWMGVADDNGIKSIKARLAAADALLRDIRDDLDIGAHPQLYKDRIDAYLAREGKP